ncbi:MAG: hypothetical protein OXT09_17410 [Myxococcales bacterium]|nr:hypothetical protein [Myxococcales bacterium]
MWCTCLALLCCRDSDGGTDAGDESERTSGYSLCAPALRVGGFEVLLQRELTSVGGRVANGVVPKDVFEAELAERGCQLLRPPNLVCEPACESGTTCDGRECIDFPVAQDVGKVAFEGLGADVELEPRGNGQVYFFNGELDAPPFGEGEAIGLNAEGGVTDGFSLDARGVAPLQVTEGMPRLRRDRLFTVTWEPGDPSDAVRVRLVLNIANHGGTPARLECEVEDSGRVTIPLDLTNALLALGNSGFPTLDIIRQSAGSVDSGLGCIDLVVASRVTLAVEIPGVVSCSGDEDCPAGERCQPDLQCDGSTREDGAIGPLDDESPPDPSDPGPDGGDGGDGDAVDDDGDSDEGDAGDADDDTGDGGSGGTGGTGGAGGGGSGGSAGPGYRDPPVLQPLVDWCGGQDEDFSFFVTSMEGLWALAGDDISDDDGGFGGNLGGLEGADAICQAIGDATGNGDRTWRAFLSATDGGDGNPVHAIDRIGQGPWHDANGGLIAETTDDLTTRPRPDGDEAATLNLVDECGLPLTVHGNAHDVVTGSDHRGQLWEDDWESTCLDWTTSSPIIGGNGTIQGGRIRSGHAFPRNFSDLRSGAEWLSEHNLRGCGRGRLLDNVGTGEGSCIGCTGGYGAIYCFAE